MSEVWIFYFFQGELGESVSVPNAFSLQTNDVSSVSLREVLAYFPIPNLHNLIFRVQMPDSECGYVWMDVSNDMDPLPRMKNDVIYMKLLRLDDENVLRRKLFLRRKDKADSSYSSAASAFNGGSGSSSRQRSSHSPPQSPTTLSMQSIKETLSADMEEEEESHQRTPASNHSNHNMLDMSSDDTDLVDFGSFVGSSPVVGASPPAVALTRDELVQRRLDEVKDRVNTALEFKHEVGGDLILVSMQ
jgi:DIX domain